MTAMPTMSHMRTLLFCLLLTACSEDVDPTANLCMDDIRQDVRMDRCSERCKPSDGSPGEVCGPDLEAACLDECMRCNPYQAWCP